MNNTRSPLLSEIERVKQDIESLTKSLKNPEEIDRRRATARLNLETLKSEVKKQENTLLTKLDALKSQITENDFCREKIDQDFAQIVQNLKNNKILYEELNEEVSIKQQRFVELTNHISDKEETFREQTAAATKHERELQREIEERNSLRKTIAGMESELKSCMRQKRAIEEKQALYEASKSTFFADIQCIEKEIATKDVELVNFQEKVRCLEAEREKQLRFSSEMDNDLAVCQMNCKRIRATKDEIEEKYRQELNTRAKYENTFKTLSQEQAVLDQALSQGMSSQESLEAEAERIEAEIAMLEAKLDDEKKSFERMIVTAEKENSRLEATVRCQQQIKTAIETQQKGSRFEALRQRLNEIKMLG